MEQCYHGECESEGMNKERLLLSALAEALWANSLFYVTENLLRVGQE